MVDVLRYNMKVATLRSGEFDLEIDACTNSHAFRRAVERIDSDFNGVVNIRRISIIGDPLPVDPAKRREYVRRIAREKREARYHYVDYTTDEY
jgi:hypothetical protein